MPACARCGSEVTEPEGPCPSCGAEVRDTARAVRAIREALEAISKAKEAGLDIERAEAEVTEAQEALALGNVDAAEEKAKTATATAEDAKRQGRARALVLRTREEIERLGRDGLPVDAALGKIQEAEEALGKGIYGQVHVLVRQAREAATEGKRRGRALDALANEEARVRAETERGVDTTAALRSIAAAKEAADEANGGQYNRALNQARIDLKLAIDRKKLEDAILATREEVADLRRQGADVTEAEGFLREASSLGGDFREAWRTAGRASRAAKAARDLLNREVIVNTVQKIVERAARGDITATQARRLVREVQDALAKGEAVEIEQMIDAQLTKPEEERVQQNTEFLQDVTQRLLTLSRAEIQLEGTEDLLETARTHLRDGRFEDAERILRDLDDTTGAMLDDVRDFASALLGRLEAMLQRAEANSLDVGPALRMRDTARTYMDSDRLPEAIELGKSAESFAAEVLGRWEAEQERRAEAEVRGTEERRVRLQERLARAAQEAATLDGSGLDLAPARDLLARASDSFGRSLLEEAERGLGAAESVLNGLWATLRNEAQGVMERAERLGLEEDTTAPIPTETRILLGEARRAFQEKHFRTAVELGEAFIAAVEGLRAEREADRQRRLKDQMSRVQTMLDQLRSALGESPGDAIALEAQRALQSENLDDQVGGVERVAERLRERLRASAEAALGSAAASIQGALGIGSDIEDAQIEYETGQELLEKGDYEGAGRHARSAEARAGAARERREADLEVERRRRGEAAKALISRMKKINEDLGRADIQMEGCPATIQAAEGAFESGRYEEVEAHLAPFVELSGTLTEGLRAAAESLLHQEQLSILAAKNEGLEVPRAEKVLATAHTAMTEERFVEALEYHKVIADIIIDARKQRWADEMHRQLDALRSDLVEAGALGTALQEATELANQAETLLRQGDRQKFTEVLEKARSSLSAARQEIVDRKFATMARDIESAREIGAEVGEAEALMAAAKDAVLTAPGTLDDYVERVSAVTDQSKRVILRARSVKDLREVRELVHQVAREGVDVEETATVIRGAEDALQEGAYERLSSALESARVLVNEARRTHLQEVFGEQVEALQSSLLTAEKEGVPLPEVRPHLDTAREAVSAGNFDAAHMALEKGEIALGKGVQQWLGTKHPDLDVNVPTAGLEAGRWTVANVSVENKGSVAAREVRLEFSGDLEVGETPVIPEIPAGGAVSVPVPVRPKSPGPLPIAAKATYRRVLDEADYDTASEAELTVAMAGTYVVEDVFIIHTDGRLVSHLGGTYKHIDEDIFSGMLSVVQDFIKDAFQGRGGGLKRFDFGGAKVLIERSKHLFVTVVVSGKEPEFMPLFMAEILRQAEERFGDKLEGWSGLLNDLEGIDDLGRQLLTVSDVPEALGEALNATSIAAAQRALRRARDAGADDKELAKLLADAKSSVEGDIGITWSLLQSAGDATQRQEDRVETHLNALVAKTSDAVGELRRLGADVGQAGVLFQQVKTALTDRDFARVRQISEQLLAALDVAKLEGAARALQGELRVLLEDLERCKADHMEVGHIEEAMGAVHESLAAKDLNAAEKQVRRAKEMLREERTKSATKRVDEQLARLAKQLADAAAEGLELPEIGDLYARAMTAHAEGREADARTLLETVEENIRPKIQRHLVEHYPRLLVQLERSGFQAGEETKCFLEVENRGNTAAIDITAALGGDFGVRPPPKAARIGPGEWKKLALGLTPKQAGASLLDIRLTYRRPLEDTTSTITDALEIEVQPPKTYPVERVVLLDGVGNVLAQEARTFLRGDDLLARDLPGIVKEGVKSDARRIPHGDRTIVIERKQGRHLAAVCTGPPPALLPLYLIECLEAVAKGAGPAGPEVAKLLWATDTVHADLGPLADSALAAALAARGGQPGMVARLLSLVQEKGFDEALKMLNRAAPPADELQMQLTGAGVSGGELARALEVLRKVVATVTEVRRKRGLKPHWPLKRMAVRALDKKTKETLQSFQKILQSQCVARELDILGPEDTWRGVKLEVTVNMEPLSTHYKTYAPRVEMMLKKQDPWKIKAGLDKGEYYLGISGQSVLVRPDVITFTTSLPPAASEEKYEGGSLYVDATEEADMKTECTARELVTAIRAARAASRVGPQETVDVVVQGDPALARVLKDFGKLVQSEANAGQVTLGEAKAGSEHPVGDGQVRLLVAAAQKKA